MPVKGYAFFETTRETTAPSAAAIRILVRLFEAEVQTTVAGQYEYAVALIISFDDRQTLEEMFHSIRNTITEMDFFFCFTDDTDESQPRSSTDEHQPP